MGGVCAKVASAISPARAAEKHSVKLRATRTPSVVSLNSLLDNPVTYQAFVAFLREKGDDALVHFLSAVRDFKALNPELNNSPTKVPTPTLMSSRSFETIMRPTPSEFKGKNAAAEAAVVERQHEIYKLYLGKNAAMKIKVDEATLGEIAGSLNKANLNIFHNAVLKIYQQVKFEFMPQFLVSDHFNTVMSKVEHGQLKKRDSFETIDEQTEALPLIEVLTDPVGCSCLLSFAATKHKAHYIQAWQEIEGFTLCSVEHHGKAGCNRRAVKIYERYFSEESPVRLKLPGDKGSQQQRVLDKVFSLASMAAKEAFTNSFSAGSAATSTVEASEAAVAAIAAHPLSCDPSLYIPTLDIVFGMITNELYDEFKSSKFYCLDLKNYGDDVVSDTASTLASLHEFSKMRRLVENKEMMQKLRNVSFDDFIKDKSNTFYLRQFLVSEFNEEHLLFYLEVEEFRAERFAQPKFGTMIVHSEDMDSIKLMNARAKKLVAKYVNVGAPFQVNLPATIREKVVEVANRLVAIDMFDAAQHEIFNMLRNDAFPRFRNSPLFATAIEKKILHFQLRNYRVSSPAFEARKSKALH